MLALHYVRYVVKVFAHFCGEIAKMVERRRKIRGMAPGSNPTFAIFFMLQRATHDMVYKIHTQRTYYQISVYTANDIADLDLDFKHRCQNT